jgi:energy-coupling factor transporter ATP-binding protein EcfA2
VTALGLSDISFHGLKQLVVLAGPNGSGKSRILQLLTQTAIYDQSRITSKANILINKTNIEGALYRHKTGEQLQPANVVTDWENQIKRFDDNLAMLATISLDEKVERINVITFVPRRVDLVDPRSIAPVDMINRADRARATGVDTLWETALSYIQQLQNRNWEVTHPSYEGTADNKKDIVASYTRLKSLIEAGPRAKQDSVARQCQRPKAERRVGVASLTHYCRATAAERPRRTTW